jgi:hypothetical protein
MISSNSVRAPPRDRFWISARRLVVSVARISDAPNVAHSSSARLGGRERTPDMRYGLRFALVGLTALGMVARDHQLPRARLVVRDHRPRLRGQPLSAASLSLELHALRNLTATHRRARGVRRRRRIAPCSIRRRARLSSSWRPARPALRSGPAFECRPTPGGAGFGWSSCSPGADPRQGGEDL